MGKIDRIYKWTKCRCLNPSARLINIQDICRGEEPTYSGNEDSLTCDFHGTPDPQEEGADDG